MIFPFQREKIIFAAVILSLVIFLIVKKIYPAMILSSVSEDLAKSRGINIKKHNLIYLLSIAVIVALGIKITGSLLVGALVVVPAAAARNFSKNLRQYSYGSCVLGILSSVSGIVVCKFFGLPAGPMIVLASSVFFVISVILKKI